MNTLRLCVAAALAACLCGPIRAALPHPDAGWIPASVISVTTSGTVAGMGGENTINGSGLDGALKHSANPTGLEVWTAAIDDGRWQWPRPPYVAQLSPSGVQGDAWIAYTFTTPQEVDEMWIWNYNVPGSGTGRGFRYVYVDYSEDGVTWVRLKNGANDDFVFNQAPGTDGYACDIKIDLGGRTVKKVLLTARFADGIHSDPSYGGLSEVLFKTPQLTEPALGAIAVPSSQSRDSGLGYQVENLLDPNTTHFWASDYGTYPNWVEIRWPQPVLADRVVIEEVDGYLTGTYRVDVWRSDTNAWQTVVGPKSNATPGETIIENFAPVTVEKLRFNALTPHASATQSGISALRVYGSAPWASAARAGLPPYAPTVSALPAISNSAKFSCTSFSATSVAPGGEVQINLTLRKLQADTADYGFQVRVGERAVPTAYFDFTNYADYTVALTGIRPAVPTRDWVVGQDYPLSVTVAIPAWAPHGHMPVRVTPLNAGSRGVLTNVTDDAVGTIKVQRFSSDPVPWPATPPTTTVTMQDGQAHLFINGQEVQPYLMTTPDFTTYQSMGEQLVPEAKIWRVLTTKNVDASYGTAAGDLENAKSFADLDQKIRNLLKVEPDAYILPTFIVRPSDAWTARWPDDATVMSDGRKIAHSLSSPRWANQLDYDYRAMVAHLMAQDYSGHIIGLHYEMAKETMYWGWAENPPGTARADMVLGDYSPHHLSAFRAWLQEKYGTVAALQAAWHDPSVTFANAYPTASVLRQMDATLMFRDPAVTRMPMDYWDFHAGQMARMAIGVGKAIKEASSGKFLTGLWGFYSNGVWTTGIQPASMVHLGYTALQAVLASPHIDYLAILQSYSHRHRGDPMVPYNLRETILRHGKMPLVEFDMRTFFTPLFFTERTYSEPETLSVLHGHTWQAALRGDALWWVGFSAGATGTDRTSIPWFASESVNAALRQSKKWYDAIRTTPSPSASEVAVFMNNGDVGAMDAFDGNGALVSAQYQTMLFELTKLGAPVDFYELNDITSPAMSQYRVFVFLNAYHLTAAQRAAIKAVVRQAGKTAVWLYGAGYNDGSTNSAAHVTDLTGIGAAVTLERRLPVVHFVPGHPLTANLPAGYTLQPRPWEHDTRPYTIGPIFQINDPAATTLGTYAHNGQTAYAAKTVGGGRSVLLAIPYLSSRVLREICREAGVFLFSNEEMYLDADEKFILVTNGGTPFQGSIALPQSSQVYDLWNDAIVGTGTSFTADLPAYQSRLYFYGTPAEVAAFQASAHADPAPWPRPTPEPEPSPTPEPTPPPSPLLLQGAVSRKAHGAAGPQDLALPLTGESGIESRSGNRCTVVASFNKEVIGGLVGIEEGEAELAAPPVFSGRTMTMELQGVADAQKLVVALVNVVASDTTSWNGRLSLRVLAGDVNANGSVSSADVGLVRRSLEQSAASPTIRLDVNADGQINADDAAIVRAALGKAVAP